MVQDGGVFETYLNDLETLEPPNGMLETYRGPNDWLTANRVCLHCQQPVNGAYAFLSQDASAAIHSTCVVEMAKASKAGADIDQITSRYDEIRAELLSDSSTFDDE